MVGKGGRLGECIRELQKLVSQGGNTSGWHRHRHRHGTDSPGLLGFVVSALASQMTLKRQSGDFGVSSVHCSEDVADEDDVVILFR